MQEEEIVVWVNRTPHYDGRMFVGVTEHSTSVVLWEESIMAVPVRKAVHWESPDRPAVVQEFQEKHFHIDECVEVGYEVVYTSTHRESPEHHALFKCHLVQPTLVQRPPEGYCLAVVAVQGDGITVQQFIP
jgi:hypothetical protein